MIFICSGGVRPDVAGKRSVYKRKTQNTQKKEKDGRKENGERKKHRDKPTVVGP